MFLKQYNKNKRNDKFIKNREKVIKIQPLKIRQKMTIEEKAAKAIARAEAKTFNKKTASKTENNKDLKNNKKNKEKIQIIEKKKIALKDAKLLVKIFYVNI